MGLREGATIAVLLATACSSRSGTDTTNPAPTASSAPADAGPPPDPCGVAGAACCTQTSAACDPRSQCVAGVCEACGQVEGQSCCPGEQCASPLACAAGTCIACGRDGDACCAGGTPCFAGLVCNASNVCANP